MTFREELSEILNLFEEIKKIENEAQAKIIYAQGRFKDFTAKHGLPERFTLPELVALGVKKATLEISG